MANMLDYLDWYGNLTLFDVPFNEVDNVILAQLAYVAFEGVVPTVAEGGSISMADAAERYVQVQGKDKIYGTAGVISPLTALLPQKLAATKRFGTARLSCFHERLDAKLGEQLCVFHVTLADGTTYVTFRGTDDTLVGWREDFEMTYGRVQAQEDAVLYVDATCAALEAPIMLGGHSKGGNLAIYAGALCQEAIRAKIIAIWNNDGPGFDEGVLSAAALDRVRARIRTYVPVFDIVGQLLDVVPPTKIVESSDSGVMQHSAMGWQVMGPELVAASPQELAPAAVRIGDAFDRWLGSEDNQTRKWLFTEFFDSLAAANVQTLSQVLSGDPDVLMALANQLSEVNPKTRTYMTALVVDLASELLQLTASDLAGAAGQIVHQTMNAPAVTDTPKDVLSAAEMARYRKRERRERTLAQIAKLFGLTAKRFKIAAAAGGAGVAALIAGTWLLDRRSSQ